MIFDETKDNGWVPLRRNIFAHVEDGRLSMHEYCVFSLLLATASAATGATKTCAAAISMGWHKTVNERQVQTALRGLEKGGYITRSRVPGVHGIYEITVLKYEITRGAERGKRTKNRNRIGKDIGTEAVTEPVTEGILVGDSLQDTYEPSSEELGTKAVTELVGKLVLTAEPIQQGQGKGEGETTTTAVAWLSPTDEEQATATPAPPDADATATTPTQTAPQKQVRQTSIPVSGGDNLPVQTEPDPPISLTTSSGLSSASASRMNPSPTNLMSPSTAAKQSSLPNRTLEFNPISWAMNNAGPVCGYSPDEVRTIIWHHWRNPDLKTHWWRDDGNITSPKRVADAITKMALQVPPDYELPSWVMECQPVADPSCQACKGQGSIRQFHTGYRQIPGDRPRYMRVECSCLQPGPMGWQKPREEGVAA